MSWSDWLSSSCYDHSIMIMMNYCMICQRSSSHFHQIMQHWHYLAVTMLHIAYPQLFTGVFTFLERLHGVKSTQKAVPKTITVLEAAIANKIFRGGNQSINQTNKKLCLVYRRVASTHIWHKMRNYDTWRKSTRFYYHVYDQQDLFATFTCNPSRLESKNYLIHGEQPSDRPDLCVCVFYVKLEALLEELTTKNVLGSGFHSHKRRPEKGSKTSIPQIRWPEWHSRSGADTTAWGMPRDGGGTYST